MKNITKRRICAAAFDIFIVYFIVVIIISMYTTLSLLPHMDTIAENPDLAETFIDEKVLRNITIVTGPFIYLIYYVFIQFIFKGATIGKMAASLKVVSDDGQKVSLLQLLTRSLQFHFALISSIFILINLNTDLISIFSYIEYFVYIIMIIILLTGEPEYTFMDKIANTKVIYTKDNYHSIEGNSVL